MTIVTVVLIGWTLVAFVALALARTLCAVAARADADHAQRTVRRPVGAVDHVAGSTSLDPAPRTLPDAAPRTVVRTLAPH